MKALFFLVTLMSWSLFSAAQLTPAEETPTPNLNATAAEKHHQEFIMFIEPTLNYTINKGYSELTIGGSGGVIINHWLIGFYGESGEVEQEAHADVPEVAFAMHHSGFRVGYVFDTKNTRAEWLVGFQTGWGGIDMETPSSELAPSYHDKIQTFMPEVGYIFPIGKITHFSVQPWLSMGKRHKAPLYTQQQPARPRHAICLYHCPSPVKRYCPVFSKNDGARIYLGFLIENGRCWS